MLNSLLSALGKLDGPGKPKLPKFVTDTIFPAIGGSYPINRSYGFSPLGPNNTAITSAPLRPEQGDTSTTFYKEPTDYTFAHEAGHLLDNRGTASKMFADVSSKGAQRNFHTDVGDNPDEYNAEAFAKALMSSRQGFKDSTNVEKRFPGTIDVIRWLQTRPPFITQKGQ